MVNNTWFSRKWLVGLVVLAALLVATGIAVPVLAQVRQAPANASSGVLPDSPTLGRVARVLGLTPTALAEQLKAGTTLARITQDKTVAEG